MLSEAALDDRVTALAAPLANAVVREYAKWPVGEVSEPNAFVRGPTVATWEGPLGALRTFLRARDLDRLGAAIAKSGSAERQTSPRK